MIQSLALFFIPVAMFLVVSMEFFGAIHITEVSILGGVLSFIAAGILFLLRLPQMTIQIRYPERVERVSFVISLFVIVYFIWTISYFGPPPIWGVLTGTYIDPEALFGNYSRKFPFRVTVTAFVLVQGMMVWIFLSGQKTCLHFINRFMTGLSFLLIAGVMEVRHPILWFVLYYICYRFHNINVLFRTLFSRKMIFLMGVFLLIWQIFVMAGSIRSGMDPTDFLAVDLAQGFRMDPAYWYLPGALVWAIIYLFGGFARGMDIATNMEFFNLFLPKNIFPSFLSFIPEELRLLPPVATDRFSAQAMAIDAFHTLCFNYGIVFGILIFLFQIIAFIYITIYMYQRFQKGKDTGCFLYALFLWLGVRILLLPIGSYFLSFNAEIELLILCFFFYIAGLKVSKAS